MTALDWFTALAAIPLAVLMIRHGLHRARWQRRKTAQVAERQARVAEDVYWLMFRKLDAALAKMLSGDAFLGIVETPAPVNGSSTTTDEKRDDWSRKVRPLADVVHFPPRVPA